MGTKVCLFVKDCKGQKHLNIKGCYYKELKIIELSKLRTKYSHFELKRQLCASYDLFLADDRIIPSLTKAIGKEFFKKKKQPIPISISRVTKLEKIIYKALMGTYISQSRGSYISIKIGKLDQTRVELIENIISVVDQLT